MSEGWVKWDNTRRKMLAMYVRGKNRHEIAKATGFHPDRISDIIHSPKFMEERAKLEENANQRVRKLFEEKASKAAEKIVKIAEEGKPHERLQFDAAKEILYQVGIKPIEVIETRKREYTPEEIESAAKVTKEVVEIVERLGKSKSPFLLEETEETPTPPAPVVNTEVAPEPATEEQKVG